MNMHAIQVSKWDKKARSLVTATIDGEAAIRKLAADLLEQWLGESAALPGFELSCDDESRGQLAVAVAPFGWALVHTAQDYATQHCTYDHAHLTEESVDVQWDEVTAIPRKWFIGEDKAMEGIRQWVQDGKLSAALPWSDQCY